MNLRIHTRIIHVTCREGPELCISILPFPIVPVAATIETIELFIGRMREDAKFSSLDGTVKLLEFTPSGKLIRLTAI